MEILINLLIVLIIFGVIYWVIGVIPLPEPLVKVRWVLYVILALIFILALLRMVPGVNFLE